MSVKMVAGTDVDRIGHMTGKCGLRYQHRVGQWKFAPPAVFLYCKASLLSDGLCLSCRVLIQEEAALAVLPGAVGERRGWTGWYQRLDPAVWRQTRPEDKRASRWVPTVHVTRSVAAVTPPSNPVSLNKILFWLNKCFVSFLVFNEMARLENLTD